MTVAELIVAGVHPTDLRGLHVTIADSCSVGTLGRLRGDGSINVEWFNPAPEGNWDIELGDTDEEPHILNLRDEAEGRALIEAAS